MKKYSLRLWHDCFSELAWLIQHGLSLQSAFHLLLKQQRLHRLHDFLFHCLHQITQGHPLSTALAISPQAHLFQAFVICGETSGTLDNALHRCTQWLAHALHFRTQCRSLLFYPLLLGGLLIGGSVLLLGVVVPQFYALYDAFHAPMPATMTALMAAHLFFVHWGIFLAVGTFGVAVIMWGIWYTFPQAKCTAETLLLHIPLAKQLCHAHECAHLGMLIAAGIPLFQAFPLLIRHARFNVHQRFLSQILEALTAGQSLATAYHHVGWHDAYLCDMLRVAEQTGTLDHAYMKLGDYYTHQLDAQLRRLKQEWQPLLMLAMGILVGSWVFLLYYPLIQLGYAVG